MTKEAGDLGIAGIARFRNEGEKEPHALAIVGVGAK
jgi:hypothetical protein